MAFVFQKDEIISFLWINKLSTKYYFLACPYRRPPFPHLNQGLTSSSPLPCPFKPTCTLSLLSILPEPTPTPFRLADHFTPTFPASSSSPSSIQPTYPHTPNTSSPLSFHAFLHFLSPAPYSTPHHVSPLFMSSYPTPPNPTLPTNPLFCHANRRQCLPNLNLTPPVSSTTPMYLHTTLPCPFLVP